MEKKQKILLAEDHVNLRELVQDYLSAGGFEVDVAGDGLEAWEAVQSRDYDLILLDVMMPEMDGFELCRKIREAENVPILFLTARVQEQDQLYGYELGADDYIVKPFSLPVLLAKCRVILERNRRTGMGDWLEAGGIRLQLSRKMVFCGEKQVSLQALDYELLQYFMKNPGRVLSREQILMKVWGHDYEGSDRAVDTHVKNLRKALGKYGKCIRTVIKSGYVFER
ncbi:MAG: response regulator transcription factor [Lachnospiraceae bacterium]